MFQLPEVASENNVLYDEHLGTGLGLSELCIVYNQNSERWNYELLPVFRMTEDEAQNLLLISAVLPEEGQLEPYFLLLSGMQTARLWQEDQLDWLEFRCGDGSVALPLQELLTGDAAKCISLLLAGQTETDAQSLAALPEVTLTSLQLRNVSLEIWVTPQELPEGGTGYQINVYACYGAQRMEITAYVPSLLVCLNAGELTTQEEVTAYAASHQVAALDASGVATELPSQLVEFPSLPLALEEDRAEYFQVTINEQDGLPVVLYEPETAVSPFRRYQLCAQWAGNAIYYIQALEQ